ncbi:hypothetical protein ACPYO6_08215 [Georgenia sp. Z1344]|uniref:hypothetical protein n=1 Tax=Georgenia sp. Z1344 TaxID=3416706 RepID=UPI003CF5B05E
MTDNPSTDGSRTSADDELAAARRRALLPTSSPERLRPHGGDDTLARMPAVGSDEAERSVEGTNAPDDDAPRDVPPADDATAPVDEVEVAPDAQVDEPGAIPATHADESQTDEPQTDEPQTDDAVPVDDQAPHGATGSGARAADPAEAWETSIDAPPAPTGEDLDEHPQGGAGDDTRAVDTNETRPMTAPDGDETRPLDGPAQDQTGDADAASTAIHAPGDASPTEDDVDADSWDAAFASGGDGVPTATDRPTGTGAAGATAAGATATGAATATADDDSPADGSEAIDASAAEPSDTDTSGDDTSDDDDSWTPLFAASRAAVARSGSSAGSADSATGHAAGSADSDGTATTRTPDAAGDATTDDPGTGSGAATATLATGAAGLAARGRRTPEGTAAGAASGTAAGATSADARTTGRTTDRRSTEDGLPDTWRGDAPQDTPPSRGAGTHLWVLLASLVLAPVAWYLVTDAGRRLTNGENTAWVTGDVVVEHVAELGAGAVLVLLLVLLSRVSSIGAWVWGVVGTLLGAAWLVVPGPLSDLIQPVLDGISDLSGVGALGENVAAHLVTDGSSGRLLLYGLALVGVAAATHGARRAGRAEGVFAAEEQRATRPRG